MDVDALLHILLVLYSMHYSYAQDSIAVEYENENITVYGNASTWAEGTPNLTVTHQVHSPPPRNAPFAIQYNIILKNSTWWQICASAFYPGLCQSLINVSCHCLPDTSSVGGIFQVTDMGPEKHESVLTSKMQSHTSQTVFHTFSITECSLNVSDVTNSETVNVTSTPCGFNCISEITCKEGYHDPENPSSMYRCNAAAEWVPRPKCTKKMPETTTGASDASPVIITPNGTPLNTSTGATADPTRFTAAGQDPFPNAGVVLAVIGGLLLAAVIGVIVCAILKEIEIANKRILNGLFVFCLIAWAVALGLVFGSPSNQSAVIGGIVVGSLAVVGVVVIIGFQIKQITSHNTKGIQGKPDPDPRL